LAFVVFATPLPIPLFLREELFADESLPVAAAPCLLEALEFLSVNAAALVVEVLRSSVFVMPAFDAYDDFPRF